MHLALPDLVVGDGCHVLTNTRKCETMSLAKPCQAIAAVATEIQYLCGRMRPKPSFQPVHVSGQFLAGWNSTL
jgi:hypothetical protein